MTADTNKAVKSLPEQIEDITKKQTVSGKQRTVEDTRKGLEAYVETYSGKKNRPADVAQSKKAIALLKKAEAVYDVSETEIYTSNTAVSAAKKVMGWIKENTGEGALIGKLCAFHDKVNEMVKKKKRADTSSTTAAPKDKFKPERDEAVIDTILAKLATDTFKDAQGKPKALGKKEITEALKNVAEQTEEGFRIAGKAVSSYVSTWIAAGKSDKCSKVHEHKGKKYHPDPE
jgi:hypothetical protein